MTNQLHKEQLYKTAYSHTFGVYVSISHAHQNADGKWIYTCSSNYSDDESRRFTNCLHNETELKSLTL